MGPRTSRSKWIPWLSVDLLPAKRSGSPAPSQSPSAAPAAQWNPAAQPLPRQWLHETSSVRDDLQHPQSTSQQTRLPLSSSLAPPSSHSRPHSPSTGPGRFVSFVFCSLSSATDSVDGFFRWASSSSSGRWGFPWLVRGVFFLVRWCERSKILFQTMSERDMLGKLAPGNVISACQRLFYVYKRCVRFAINAALTTRVISWYALEPFPSWLNFSAELYRTPVTL
jgi:hypothetical protein